MRRIHYWWADEYNTPNGIPFSRNARAVSLACSRISCTYRSYSLRFNQFCGPRIRAQYNSNRIKMSAGSYKVRNPTAAYADGGIDWV